LLVTTLRGQQNQMITIWTFTAVWIAYLRF